MLIGRNAECERLKQAIDDDKSHFIALYGRRRVGKTYLVKEYFQNKFTFYCTGLLKGSKKQQLANFTNALQTHFNHYAPLKPITNWYEAFHSLHGLNEIDKKRKESNFYR